MFLCNILEVLQCTILAVELRKVETFEKRTIQIYQNITKSSRVKYKAIYLTI